MHHCFILEGACIINFVLFDLSATKTILSESLIILGEIGGNDYNFWLLSRRPRDVDYQFIPDVVSIIINTAQVLTLHANTFGTHAALTGLRRRC
jgi:hypothetical protein